MSSRQAQACMRLSTLGLQQTTVHQILDQVNTWVRCNGEEWTVDRLKALKQLYLNHLGGGDKNIPQWIAQHPDGTPKGPFRALFKVNHFKGKAKALNALMVYTSLERSGAPTPKQWKKFQSAVEAVATESTFSVAPDIKFDFELGAKVDIFHFPWSSSRMAPGYTDRKTVPETDFYSQWFGFFHSWTNLKIKNEFYDIYSDVTAGNLSGPPYHTSNPFDSDGVGKVSFIQEPGYKLRAIANPHRFHQLALEPLKEGLLRSLRGVREDCTHDQDSGTQWVYDQLRSGNMVHCLDLSSATDRFPAELTFDLLRRNRNTDTLRHVNLFERLSRSRWMVNDPERGQRLIRWEVGQPLGLGPSFPAFALSHHAVVKTLQRDCGGDYRIIGDDIAMVGDRLASAYRRTMEDLGVEVSSVKSISSDRVAEFAGRVITPEGVMPTVKWREISDRNFMDYTRFFGHQFIGALRPQQKAVAKALAEVPEPYGGLGFNPKGKSWERRVDENWKLIESFLSEGETLVHASDTTLPMSEARKAGIVAPQDLRTTAMGVDPTGSTLSRIIQSREVTSGLFREEDDIPLTPSERKGGDPRGPDTLSVLQRKIRQAEHLADLSSTVSAAISSGSRSPEELSKGSEHPDQPSFAEKVKEWEESKGIPRSEDDPDVPSGPTNNGGGGPALS